MPGELFVRDFESKTLLVRAVQLFVAARSADGLDDSTDDSILCAGQNLPKHLF